MFPVSTYYGDELVAQDYSQLPVSAEATDEIFTDVAKSSAFLPRLQLYWSNNKECKIPVDKGGFPMNHYGLVLAKNNIKDLGEQVEIYAFRWRPKAMQIMDDGSIISKYKAKDPAFLAIAEKSEVQNSGCMFGPEFLVWIPKIKRFATFFMASKSSRMEAPNLKAKIDEQSPATLDSTFIESKKFSWQVPVVKGCSTPIEMPSMDSIMAEVNKFINPPDDEIEAAPEAAGNQRAR